MPALTQDNINPIGPRLLIEPFTQAKETSGGLIMSDGDGHATPVYGRVLKVGLPGSIFKVGDCLLFRRYAIDSLKAYTAEGDKEIYLLEENEVIGVVRDGVDTRVKQSDTSQINELTNVKEKEVVPEEAAAEGSKKVG